MHSRVQWAVERGRITSLPRSCVRMQTGVAKPKHHMGSHGGPWEPENQGM